MAVPGWRCGEGQGRRTDKPPLSQGQRPLGQPYLTEPDLFGEVFDELRRFEVLWELVFMLCQSLQDSHAQGQQASCQVWAWMPAFCAMPTSALPLTHRGPKQVQPLWFLTNPLCPSSSALPIDPGPTATQTGMGQELPWAYTGCVGSWRS